jgi:ABC-type lipoprotein release transport system permease subunit
VNAGDPVTFGAVTTVLLGAALAACALPAARAAALAPAEVLRQD